MDLEENEYRKAQLKYIEYLEKKVMELENELNSVKSKNLIVEPIINPYPMYPWAGPYTTPGTGTPDWTFRPSTTCEDSKPADGSDPDLKFCTVVATTTNPLDRMSDATPILKQIQKHEAEENGY